MADKSDQLIHAPFPEPPAQGEALEVADGVLWMRLPLPMKLNHVNLYAFDEGDSWTLIDAGMKWPKADEALAALRDGPLGGKPISRLIVTHYHPDHVGYWGDLAREGVETFATRTSYLMARMLTADVQETHPPENILHYTRAGMPAEMIAKRKTERPFNFADIVAPLPIGYSRLQDGETIKIGGRVWDIRTGEGHAPEHATFWSRDDALVLSGDQILPSISPNLSIYPAEPEANPVAEFLASCRAFLPLAREDHFVLGGHKLPFTGLAPRLHQLIDNHEGAFTRLRRHLTEPHSGAECFAPIFKREIGEGEYGMALGEAFAHCVALWHAGEVSRVLRDDGAWAFQVTS